MEPHTMESLPLDLSQDGPSALMASIGHDPGKVAALEDAILHHPAQVLLNAEHLVHGGMYARTMFIPAGTVLTGALVNSDNVCVMCGDITVTTTEGPKRFSGFHVIPAPAGHKRAGFAHSDTYWTALFRTDLKEVADIEDSLTDESGRLMSRRFEFLTDGHAVERIES